MACALKRFKIEIDNTKSFFGVVRSDKSNTWSSDIVTLKAYPASNYELDKLTTEPEIKFFDGYKFRMPTEGVKITPTFVKSTDKIFTFCSDTLAGTLKADKTKANPGETVTLTLTLNDGYTFNYYECTPSTLVITDNQFVMPSESVWVTAHVTATDYVITYNTTTNGSLSSATSAHAGQKISVTGIPVNDNYKLSGISTTPATTITNNEFKMPASNVIINGTFTTKDYSVKCLTNSEGNLYASQEFADEGEIITLYSAPLTRYKFTGYSTSSPIVITDDKFTMPAENVEIDALYETLTAGTGCYYKFNESEGILYLKGTEATDYVQYNGANPILGSETENAKIKSLIIDDSTTIPLPADCTEMFGYAKFTNMQYVDLNIFDTSNVINMMCMFMHSGHSNCIINLNGWDTSKVTEMFGIFANCDAKDLIIKDWNVEQVSDFYQAFASLDNISYLNLENWYPKSATIMERMFAGDSSNKVKGINLANFDWTTATCDTQYMFTDCSKLRTIYCNNDWSAKCKTVSSEPGYKMFEDAINLLGQTGLTYSADKINANYAKSTDGYFTLKDT